MRLVTVTLLLTGLILGLAAGCTRTPPSNHATNQTDNDDAAAPTGPAFFENVTAASGIDFAYRNGEEAGNFAILESIGGGVAFLDYDGDGLLDVFLAGGGYFEGTTIKGHPCKLFKNLGGLRFRDVTQEAGLGGCVFYTHALASADYDRDGWPDLAVAGWGGVRLFRNEPHGQGGRRFVETTTKAGLTENLWATSVAWGDLDGDGYPDLYVCQYADWSFEKRHPECKSAAGMRDVCGPSQFTGLPHKLFRNNRHGAFTDATAALGPRHVGRGLGIVMVDINGDGKPDVYVTNDTDPKFLYVNRTVNGDLRLEEKGVVAGAAFDESGNPNASMGVAAADYNGSGRASLFVTNYLSELHALYRNECNNRREMFTFATQATGIAVLGTTWVGWGTGFLDIDHHGWEDLVVAHGHAVRHADGAFFEHQLPALFRNENGRFTQINSRGGAYFREMHRGRGIGFGDLDNDGRIDLVISHLNEPVTVLRNVADTSGNSWIGFELAGRDHRDIVGSTVTVHGEQRRFTRFAKGGESYASSGDRRLVFGLGASAKIRRVEVQWSWGEKQTWEGLTTDRYWRLTEGKPEAEETRPRPKATTP